LQVIDVGLTVHGVKGIAAVSGVERQKAVDQPALGDLVIALVPWEAGPGFLPEDSV
jgi:hypothetical protein